VEAPSPGGDGAWRRCRWCCEQERGPERELSVPNERGERGGSGRGSGGRPGRCRGVAWPPRGGRGLPARHGGNGGAVARGRWRREGEGVCAGAG